MTRPCLYTRHCCDAVRHQERECDRGVRVCRCKDGSGEELLNATTRSGRRNNTIRPELHRAREKYVLMGMPTPEETITIVGNNHYHLSSHFDANKHVVRARCAACMPRFTQRVPLACTGLSTAVIALPLSTLLPSLSESVADSGKWLRIPRKTLSSAAAVGGRWTNLQLCLSLFLKK